MKPRIKNVLHVLCEDVDLNLATNIEFYVKQMDFFGEYIPVVVSPHEMYVEIPCKDAHNLAPHLNVQLQFAYTDENGIPRASEIEIKSVGDFLKEAGYDPT